MGNLIKDPPSSNGPNNSNGLEAFTPNYGSGGGIESTIPGDIQSTIDNYFYEAEGGLAAADPGLANYLDMINPNYSYGPPGSTVIYRSYSDGSHIGNIGNVISAVYNMTGQLLGSNAGVTYENSPGGGLSYSYTTGYFDPTGDSGQPIGGPVLHYGTIKSNVDYANQGVSVTDFFPIKYGPGPFNGAGGVQINVGFNDPGLGYSSYNWVQVLDKGAGPVVDSQYGGSLYYTKDQATEYSNFTYQLGKFEHNPLYVATTFTSFFNDGPAVHSGSFAAQLTLVGFNADGTITPIVSMNYGFTFDGNNSVQRVSPVVAPANSYTLQAISTYNQTFK